MTAVNAHAPTIIIRERYRDMVSGRWPVVATPQPDELLSSWLHRLAFANGVPARAFARVLGLTRGMWSARLDLRLSIDVASQLQIYAGISLDQLTAMTLSHTLPMQLLLPLRNHRQWHGSTWLQFCSQCLADDTHPYFRRGWRLATRLACNKHGSRLRDRCPSCRRHITAFDQSELMPHHYCALCGYDLRRASAVDLCPAARNLDQCIHGLCSSGSIGSSPAGSLIILRLLNIPQSAGIYQRTVLTGLSTSARARCFARLVGHPGDEGMEDYDDHLAGVQPRIRLAREGGDDALIGLLSDALGRKPGRSAADNDRLLVDLSHVLGAAQQMGRISTKAHPRMRGSAPPGRCQC
ncbi:hypothetical protein ELI38_35110 (plasmid) [Rhizobium leguminosarum]|nr:TniQ family protein [Rhizobium leguminosarum]TAU80627.1 hypothetical protein ELI38_35110 [Rhizobium leguminosarum]